MPSPSSSHSSSSVFGSAGTPILPRGSACLNCKRRKIRCDGTKPKCGPCSSSRAFEDCEYPGSGATQTEALQADIERLEGRLRQLESFPRPSPHDAVLLNNPYHSVYKQNGPGTSHRDQRQATFNSQTSTGSSNTQQGNSRQVSQQAYSITSPPPDVFLYLLSKFYYSSSKLGFFLDKERFHRSATLQLPTGDPNRPAPSLIYAITLWGNRLSSDEVPRAFNESTLLPRALRQINEDLAGTHPKKVLHVLQAEILLAYFFFNDGKDIDAVYHMNAAVALVVSAKLHLIGSNRHSAVSGSHSGSRNQLPPPVDSIEQGERIDAFWNAVILSNYWAVMEPSQLVTFYDSHGITVDTPWPLDNYSYGVTVDSHGNGNTIRQFLNGKSSDGFSTLAILAKSSILFKKVAEIGTGAGFAHPRDAYDALSRLDHLIEQFISYLPLAGQVGIAPAVRYSLGLSQMLASTAVIKLHSSPMAVYNLNRDTSWFKCLSAAKSIASVTASLKLNECPSIDSILGSVWYISGDTLATELEKFAQYNDVTFRADENHARNALGTIVRCMAQCSTKSTVIASSRERLYRNHPIAANFSH